MPLSQFPRKFKISRRDFKHQKRLHEPILSIRFNLYVIAKFKVMKNHLMMYLFQHTNSSKQKLRYKLKSLTNYSLYNRFRFHFLNNA